MDLTASRLQLFNAVKEDAFRRERVGAGGSDNISKRGLNTSKSTLNNIGSTSSMSTIAPQFNGFIPDTTLDIPPLVSFFL
jgi:hypothetical protein